MKPLKKIAVAARGEIAKRIISTCQEMGLKTVLLHSAGDTKNSAYRWADERICIGPADPLKSYLNIEENINGALGAGGGAIHPGYGFLSENPEFAKRCEEKGLVFIGPSPEMLSLFGNKVSARKAATKAGVPVLPSWTGDFSDENLIFQKAKEITYPLMIKAASGGGGRGMRKVKSNEELKEFLPVVRSEALQSFNSEELFLEKYLESARHIELQIFVSADKELFILGDRDCSSQRRHQKIIEEAPSQLPESLKKEMDLACRELFLTLNYQGAGTLEFLVQDNKFYFLEMNTRLQVEHTVTEMIYGVDLVKAQILTAGNQPAFFSSEKLQPKGHSLQCRICAEDPYQNFQPSVGSFLSVRWPGGKNIRVDTAYQTGDEVSPFYDSLIAKIIVWEDSRVRAIEKMKNALKETIIFGVSTNIPFLNFLLGNEKFVHNKMEVSGLEKIHSLEWKKEALPLPEDLLYDLLQEFPQRSPSSSSVKFNPWTDFLNKGQ